MRGAQLTCRQEQISCARLSTCRQFPAKGPAPAMKEPGRPNDTPRTPRLLSAVEAADTLGVSVLTVRLWARHRKIPHRRIGSRILFAPDDVRRIIEKAFVRPREES